MVECGSMAISTRQDVLLFRLNLLKHTLFLKGWRSVKKINDYGYINKRGEWVIEPKFDGNGSAFKEGLTLCVW